MNDLSVVIPCYNEDEKIVETLYTELTAQGCEVIVVDDGATMNLPSTMKTISHFPNMGYGYAIKQGIKVATKPIICTMDGDNQHKPSDVKRLYQVYKACDCKMIIGQRWGIKEATHRTIGRKFLNFLASIINRHYFPDLNSGMRIFDRELALNYRDILCDTFSFTTSITMAFVTDGHKTATIPIDVRPRSYGRSHVRVIKDGLVTLFFIVWVGLALRTRRIRAWIRNILGQ